MELECDSKKDCEAHGALVPDECSRCGKGMELGEHIANAINGASRENNSNTPDFILGAFLVECLESFESACKAREDWYGVHNVPAQVTPLEFECRITQLEQEAERLRKYEDIILRYIDRMSDPVGTAGYMEELLGLFCSAVDPLIEESLQNRNDSLCRSCRKAKDACPIRKIHTAQCVEYDPSPN